MASESVPARNLPVEPAFTFSPFLRGVFSHDRDIPIGLIGDHLPASGKAGQDRGFGSALRQEDEAVTFLGVRPAAAGFADFPPGIKGQRRPARCTRPAPTKPRMLRSGSPSTALAMVAGSIALTAGIEAWCPLQ
jgi:hypothetical protein